MSKCSIGSCSNNSLNSNNLDDEQNKCILHSKKDKYKKSIDKLFNHSLVIYITENLTDKNEIDLIDIFFPEDFNYQIIFNLSNHITFRNCTFNKQNLDIKLDLNNCKKIHFISCEFNKKWLHFNIYDICYSECNFHDCIIFYKDYNNQPNKINMVCIQRSNIYQKFDLDFSFDNVELCEVSMLDLSDTVFHEKVEIKQCKINNANLINTKFLGLCDFYKTIFIDDPFFYKTTFNDISVFTESIFNKNVNFQYTTFSKLVLFRKTQFKGSINLIDSLIQEEANFLDIKNENQKKLEVNNIKNRETARIIKHSFEKQDNIIEANKFYALEMEKRGEELKFLKTPFEWLVFKTHKISSNHSQDWVLTLFWIINITFIYGLVWIQNTLVGSILTFFIPLISIMGLSILVSLLQTKLKTIILIVIILALYPLYGLLSNDYQLIEFSKNINPFSIMTGNYKLNFGLFIYKILIAYLIYQLVISIRQNTRRR